MTSLLHNLELVEFRKNEITIEANIRDFQPTIEREYVQCLVAPTSSSNVDDFVDETFTLYLFESIDVSFYDEVLLRGKVGVVVGTPRLWMAPTSKRIKGQEIHVRIIANEVENATQI